MDLSIFLTFLSLLPTVSYCQDPCTDLRSVMVYNGITMGHQIKSSGFPYSTYDSYTNECWLFTNSDHSDILRVEFRDFSTEVCCDIVHVFDGKFAKASKVITRLSGTKLNSTSLKYRSTGRHLFIWFNTDSSDDRRGWEACICPSDPYCTCSWHTSDPSTTTRRPTTRSTWGSGSDAGRTSLSTGYIVGIVVVVLMAACFVVGLCWACGFARRRSRRRATATTTTTAMTRVNSTNLLEGTYRVPQGVSYTTNQDETPLISLSMMNQPNMRSQPIPDAMQVPSYDSALSYPSPNHAAETSPSAPPLYLAETDHQTVPTTGASTRHTDSSDITHSGNSVPPDTSTQEPVSPPPSYDQLYS